MVIYYPFMKLLDNQYLEEEKNKVDEVDEIDELSFDDLSLD